MAGKGRFKYVEILLRSALFLSKNTGTKAVVVIKMTLSKKYAMLFVVLLFAFCCYNVMGSYGFVLFPDEFGYWACAARLAGYDWSDIASLGSYYSYGYSVLLFPIFLLCTDGVWAYRLAIILNVFMLVAIFFVLRNILGRLFSSVDNNLLTIFAIISTMYPPLLFYSRTTMAEVVLAFMYVLICALLYEYFTNNKLWMLVLAAAAFTYIYYVHMRSVGVLIAGVIAVAVYGCLKNKKHLLTFLVVLAVLMFAGSQIKELVIENIYAAADSEMLSVNDYSGQMSKLGGILTAEGIKNLIISVAGKVLYIGVASFGLAYWGLVHCLRVVFEKSRTLTERIFYLFILLSTAGETLIGSFAIVNPWRVDTLVYGRYHEFVIPVLMMIGAYALWTSKKTFIWTLAMLAAEIPMLLLVIYSLVSNGQSGFMGSMSVGMCYVYNENSFQPVVYYWQAYIFGAFLTLALMGILMLMRKKDSFHFFMAIIVAAEFALTIRAYDVCPVDSSALGAFRDMRVVEKIEDLCHDNTRRVLYIDKAEDGENIISIMQFMLRDIDITIYKRADEHGKDVLGKMESEDLVLLDYRDEYSSILAEIYDHIYIYGHFALLYNDL